MLGAFIAQSVDKYPLEKAKRTKFRILNQSRPNSQVGGTSKSVKRKDAMNIILAAERKFMVRISKSKAFLPAAKLPIVSNRLVTKFTISRYQLSVFYKCKLLTKLNSVSYTVPGFNRSVIMKMNISA